MPVLWLRVMRGALTTPVAAAAAAAVGWTFGTLMGWFVTI
jgi:hypothetical protein